MEDIHGSFGSSIPSNSEKPSMKDLALCILNLLVMIASIIKIPTVKYYFTLIYKQFLVYLSIII